MLLLNRAQRAMLVDLVPDIANVAAGALLFGQVLGERPFSPAIALFGVAIWLVLIGWSVALAAGDE